MRTLPIPFLMAMCLATPATFAHEKARKDDPWYVQFGLGLVSASDTDALDSGNNLVEVGYDTGLGATVGLGYDLGGGDVMGWAIEAEAVLSSYNLDEGDLGNFTTTSKGASAFAVMGNLVLDFHTSDTVSWYVGGGIGYATSVELETFDTGSQVQNDTDAVAGQFKTGLRYELGNLVNVLVGYRFFSTDDIEIAQAGQVVDATFENHIFEVVMRWGF